MEKSSQMSGKAQAILFFGSLVISFISGIIGKWSGRFYLDFKFEGDFITRASITLVICLILALTLGRKSYIGYKKSSTWAKRLIFGGGLFLTVLISIIQFEGYTFYGNQLDFKIEPLIVNVIVFYTGILTCSFIGFWVYEAYSNTLINVKQPNIGLIIIAFGVWVLVLQNFDISGEPQDVYVKGGSVSVDGKVNVDGSYVTVDGSVSVDNTVSVSIDEVLGRNGQKYYYNNR